jgi:di/tricarboxylate transporter
MKTFRLFDVTPIGVVLLATGILYFVVAGSLPAPS